MDWIAIADFVQQNQLPIMAGLVALWLITLPLLLLVWLNNRKQYSRLQPLLNQADATLGIAATLERQEQGLDELKNALASLSNAQHGLEQNQKRAVQGVGFYRYNAFPDVGGELSFSLALLNGEQAGVVITSIFGRQEARVYAKPIKVGSSSTRLSREEQEAIRRATLSKRFLD